MPPRDMLLAALTSVIWGLAFAATKFGLQSFSPPDLAALRFLVACPLALLVPRPPIAWRLLLLIGLTLFAGQFLLLFFAFQAGMPPGLASVSQQMQAFFTVLLAARFLHDRPSRQQIAGMSLAFGGLILIGLTIGGDLKPMALGLALAGALSWAVGNVLVKQARHVPIFPLVVWASLVPPLPALALAGLTDEISLPQAVAAAGWSGIGAALYLGAAATVVGYALWGGLLQRHASGAVAPFALISPCVGVVSSAWLFGESFPPLRLAGMGLIVCGLAITVLPAGRRAPVRWPCPPSSAWPRDR